MKLTTKLLLVLIVLMLIPTFALAKEVTDGTNYTIDVPDTYEEIAENQFGKSNGENFSVFASEPLENTELSEEEFKTVTDYVVSQVEAEGKYTIKHMGNEVVTVTKNNYKAYLAKFQMTYGSIVMNLRQYYFVTPEKSVLFTETRFDESQYDTEEAKGLLDSLTLLNCTPPVEKKSLISEKETEPENKASALISEKTEEPAEKSNALIAEKEDTVTEKTDYTVPIAIIVVAAVLLLIVKMATGKKTKAQDTTSGDNNGDNSNL